MSRLLSSTFLLLAFISAYAQNVKPEPPVEHASPVTVILFLVLFVGTCVAYAGYLWWSGRKGRQQRDE